MRILLFLCLMIPFTCSATNINISQVSYLSEKKAIQFTVSWDNSWHNSRNHDAAWVFFKVVNDNGGYRHIYLDPSSARQVWKGSGADASIELPADGTGLMISSSSAYRGSVSYRIEVKYDTARIKDRDFNYFNGRSLLGYGIEMVQIPEGGYTLGDPDTTALNYGAFYQSDDSGDFAGLIEITREIDPIEVAHGALWYRVNEPAYQGDQKGPVPAEYPKGVREFYLMKYEVSQGLYAAFLNSLGSHAASVRYTSGTPSYSQLGGTISLQDGVFKASNLNQRMVFWHWEDMMAFTDWAGLRPYTELEYTKACRGPLKPLPHEMPWNTTDLDNMQRRINPQTHEMEAPPGLTEGDLTDANRVKFGASYYWVMDLAGSMWEKVITIGDPVGRAFTGSHGDGQITYYGNADVLGWPEGYKEVQGYGYRGGGYYGRPDITDFNPYSPIAYRRYGAWSGGARNAAYGYRAARTLD